MTITEKDREILIKYRIDQAHEAIEAAKILIDSNKLKSAANRIYYGMFYILSALALKHKFRTSRHQGLIAIGIYGPGQLCATVRENFPKGFLTFFFRWGIF